MDLDALLALPEIEDVIITATALYIVTSTRTPPTIYSDKQLIFIHPTKLLQSPHLLELLQGVSKKHPDNKRLRATLLYTYSFDGLDQNTKQTISHTLNGTGGRKSLLDELQGERIGRGALLLPQQHKKALETFFDEHNVTYAKRKLYEEVDA